MKAYKGFDKNMQCRGFQFEEGKTYHEDEAELCKRGFHACENPLDVFGYYSPGKNSIYREVELEDVSEERNSDGTKVCAKTIKIGAKLDVAGLCKAHFEYVSARCNPANGRVAGDKESAAAGESGSAAAGESGSAAAGESGSAAAGNWGSAAAGYNGSAAAGYKGSAAAGNNGSAAAGYKGSAAAGNNGSAAAGESGSAAAGESGSAAAGYNGSAAAGNWGSAAAGNNGSAAAGYKGSAAAGNWGSAAAGKQGIACCRGGKVKGDIGAVLALSELDNKGNNISAKAVIVDGETIKANTWYTLKNGEFMEV